MSTLKAIIDSIGIRHGDTIFSFFEMLLEPWMDEDEKIEFVLSIMDEIGKTFIDLDNELEIGVKNGYPLDVQIELCKKLFIK